MAITITAPGGNITVRVPNWNVRVAYSKNKVTAKAGSPIGGIPYNGAYEADALFSQQTFPTAQKTMRQDFTVHAINYTEAPNESGVTVTIGG